MNLRVLPAMLALTGGQAAGLALGTYATKKLKEADLPPLSEIRAKYLERNKFPVRR